MATKASVHTTIRELSTKISQREKEMRRLDKVANSFGDTIWDSSAEGHYKYRKATDKERKEASDQIKQLDPGLSALKAALSSLSYCVEQKLL